jgi:hypothetical protein
MGSVLNVDNIKSISWINLRINYTHIITTVKTCKWKFIETIEKYSAHREIFQIYLERPRERCFLLGYLHMFIFNN